MRRRRCTRSSSHRKICRPTWATPHDRDSRRSAPAPADLLSSDAMNGYGGRMLFVDLTSGRSRVEPLSASTARALLGGNGLAARLLLDLVPPGTDAFDPANAIVFAVGPITDTTVPGNSRACVASKSPLTGLFFDSTFGGRFPATLKRT